MTLIHYTGWNSSWDEWVPAGRIHSAGAVIAPQQALTPLDPVAFQQMVGQNPENARQQIMQLGQQIQQQFQLVSTALRQ